MKTKLLIAMMLLSFGWVLQAQNSTNATGGEATGTNGTASYTVGQLFYSSSSAANGNVTPGVQQAYEISTTLGIDEKNINLGLSVYPNPTTNFLTLKIEDSAIADYSFQLLDLHGRLLETQKVKSASTNVAMERFPKAIYLLKVSKNNQVIKIFKIIKN